MAKLICSKCMRVHETKHKSFCPLCNATNEYFYLYNNSDEYLKKEVPRILQERKKFGFNRFVGGLECIIINTEFHNWEKTIKELLNNTGAYYQESFQTQTKEICVLRQEKSADILIQRRKKLKEENPFISFNIFPKSKHLPNTRLETFVYETKDIEKYVGIQKKRGVHFLTENIQHNDSHSFIQTTPSNYTGNSIGFIQWHEKQKIYTPDACKITKLKLKNPENPLLKNIKKIDHAATRVKAEHRDAAIIEFMELTNYTFDFAIYVKLFNSITNVARLSQDDFAMVFTSGVTPFINIDVSGPTEKFIHNYGARTHHLAFQTDKIEETFKSLEQNGMKFLIKLVGSQKEGLKQTFTVQSKTTMLVNEYIHRYGNFDGFFTKSNVSLLTKSTEKQ